MKVLLAVLATCGALLQGRADPEVHLIPAGYVGEVTIVFRAANGEAPAADGDARLYRIPQNGILLTQAHPNVGLSPAWRFFSVTLDGERTPILRILASTVADTPENRAHPAVEIFYPRRGRMRAGSGGCDIEFDQYFVGTRAQLLNRNSDVDRRRLGEYLGKTFVCQ